MKLVNGNCQLLCVHWMYVNKAMQDYSAIIFNLSLPTEEIYGRI